MVFQMESMHIQKSAPNSSNVKVDEFIWRIVLLVFVLIILLGCAIGHLMLNVKNFECWAYIYSFLCTFKIKINIWWTRSKTVLFFFLYLLTRPLLVALGKPIGSVTLYSLHERIFNNLWKTMISLKLWKIEIVE